MIEGFIVGFSVVVGYRLVQWWKQRPKSKSQYECVCGKQLKARRAHVVVKTYSGEDLVDEEIEGAPMPGEMTGVAADFCKAHCPGGCRKGCESRAS